uniref:Uncharacterized protein n=1 Tax=Moniliophthora roreri TaxID=221103 RepID=A0A0W0GF72_MONRR
MNWIRYLKTIQISPASIGISIGGALVIQIVLEKADMLENGSLRGHDDHVARSKTTWAG